MVGEARGKHGGHQRTEPGIQFLMMSLDSGLSVTLTSAKPAARSTPVMCAGVLAPLTQQASAVAFLRFSGSSAVETTSATASRPPGLSTRNTSV